MRVVSWNIRAGGGKRIAGIFEQLLQIDPEVKAILSSGYCTDTVVVNYKEYGFKGRVNKPYDIKDLEKVINEVI